MKKVNRAETPAKKIAKGEFILSTAENLAPRDGLDALSMNALCAACGVAKGTLYLYFKTRHEILAALFLKTMGEWGRRLGARVANGPEYAAFCQAYAETLKQDTLLIALMHHAHQNFDHGLPDETYQETLSSFQRLLEKQADIFCDVLSVDSETASQMVWAFYTAALGAGHFMSPAKKLASLPKELGQFRDALSFDTLFLNVVAQIKRSS